MSVNVGAPVNAFPLIGGTSGEGDCNEDCVIDCETLVDAALEPQSHTVDGQTTVNRGLQDLIALDKHLRSKRLLCNQNGNGWGGIAKSRVVTPSATGD